MVLRGFPDITLLVLVLILDATFDIALLAVSADVGQLLIDMALRLFDINAVDDAPLESEIDDALLESEIDDVPLESVIDVMPQDFAVDETPSCPVIIIVSSSSFSTSSSS